MANTMAQHALLFCSIALLSIVIPIGIFIGRNNVRSTRGQWSTIWRSCSASPRNREGRR